jgi:tetratricopeptide (TPR) repeat protein
LTRDNVLFILIGILAGFIAGYLMHEVMAERQPARLVHGDSAAMPPGGSGGPGAGGGQDQQTAAQARAREVQEMQQLQTFLQENPDNPAANLRLATLAYDTQAWPLCVSGYEHYLELTKEDPDILSDLGVCYHQMGNPEKAIEAFDRAQAVQPDHWQSRFNEILILTRDLGDYERAEKVLAELRELQPDNPQVEQLAAEVEREKAAAS